MRVQIIRTTPHGDKFLKPGDVVDVDDGLAADWKRVGKAKELGPTEPAPAAVARPGTAEQQFVTPPGNRPPRKA